MAALDPPAAQDALLVGYRAVVEAVAHLESGLDWTEIARRGAESPAQREALLAAPAVAGVAPPATPAYQQSLAAVWQLIRRLNEERELPPDHVG